MSKIERTKNATRNIVFGIVLKAYQILVPFLMRTAMIYFMGVQYLGLNSLFTSILQVLNLAELGVGSAMIYSMYKPIAEDNSITVCALMKLYRTYYRVIGLVIAVIGCVLTPFIPKLISGDIPDGLNIYILYLLNLGATVLSYWLFAYKNSVLQAYQRTDVVSKVMLATSTIQYALQLFVLWAFRNYYLYVIVMLATQAITNVATALIADKLYPQFKPAGQVAAEEKKAINGRIKDLFTSKIGAIIVNSADTIVISAFLGLTALAIYQNYYFILTSIMGFIAVVFAAVTAGIGNSLVVETKEKNFKDLNVFTFIICWISGFCSCCFLNLYQPFMELWVGKDLMLDFPIVVCFVLYFYVYEVNQLLNTYKDAGGIWHEDRFRPLVTAITNLGMNLIMVQFWGLYGIILSTVLSMLLVGMPWLFHNLFTTMFEKKNIKQYLVSIAFYVFISFITGCISVLICKFINFNLWLTLLIRLIICLIVPNMIFLLVYHKRDEFKRSIFLVNKMLHGKIDFIVKKVNSQVNRYYTDEENTLILVSLLKAHGIKKVIASPGTTNISFVGSVQFDPYFEVYSAVDERAAAFMACGLSEESGEPVVLTCTGATASRNYIPGLTEAYYRHLPILAVTSTQHSGRVGNYVAQVIDRSEQFMDMVKKSYQLPTVHSEEDKQYTITAVNDAILELRHGECGPIHINLVTTYSNGFNTKQLPEYRVIKRVVDHDFPKIPKGNIGIFVGAHGQFTSEETEAIDRFCASNNAVVICDQISNYRGKYRFLANFVNSQERDFGTRKFDLIIYIGYVHGAYINFQGNETWRINKDGVIRDPYRNLTYVFEMEEKDFFRYYVDQENENTLIQMCNDSVKRLKSKLPELPFSNMWIAKETASFIPENSVLHLSILNTLRVWNYFETPSTVLCYSNSGGYGIDGCLSSFIGSALVNRNIEHFMIIGDLSFFYDIDTLFNELPANMHIMLINNGVGTEFKNYNHRAAYFGEDADRFMAAKGHNGFKNPDIVKTICANRNVRYMCASNKKEYLNQKDRWIRKGDSPVLIEIFTTDKDESDALKLMNSVAPDESVKARLKRSAVGKIVKRIIRGA